VVLLHGAEPGLLQELLGPQGQVRGARSRVLELISGTKEFLYSGSSAGKLQNSEQFNSSMMSRRPNDELEQTSSTTTSVSLAAAFDLFCSSCQHFCLQIYTLCLDKHKKFSNFIHSEM